VWQATSAKNPPFLAGCGIYILIFMSLSDIILMLKNKTYPALINGIFLYKKQNQKLNYNVNKLQWHS
jgi:hypothetical protein